MTDMLAFAPDEAGLRQALDLLLRAEAPRVAGSSPQSMDAAGFAAELPSALPRSGIGPAATLDALATPVLTGARDLRAPGFFAHMDPPTPWITWAMHLWTASRNQNLLHPDSAPVARLIEETVLSWLAPVFGMQGGHMTPGSSVANITAIWAAREAGASVVISTRNAHLSVEKAARLLGMRHLQIDSWDDDVDPQEGAQLDDAVVVITAGTTSSGHIEPLHAARNARWRHIDAAWAGPLLLSQKHRSLLDGIETADSVAVSAHKWFFQPKESALVLFADVAAAHASVSIDADYLSVPNVGLLGSHGASAVPLAATFMAYGTDGVAAWIDRSMELAHDLWAAVETHPDFEARTPPQAGVLNWRHRIIPATTLVQQLPDSVFVSTTTIDGEPWLKSVAANPNADPALVFSAMLIAAGICADARSSGSDREDQPG